LKHLASFGGGEVAASAEGAERAASVCLDGSYRAAHALGDDSLRQVGQEAQNEHLALAAG
jgi:hypothetical protein